MVSPSCLSTKSAWRKSAGCAVWHPHPRLALGVGAGVFARLGITPGAAPVFIIRAKDVIAWRCAASFGRAVHLFNGVFLNRSILHLLDEPELASVIGHELGHVFPHAPLLSRCYLLHAIFAGLVSFSLASLFESAGLRSSRHWRFFGCSTG